MINKKAALIRLAFENRKYRNQLLRIAKKVGEEAALKKEAGAWLLNPNVDEVEYAKLYGNPKDDSELTDGPPMYNNDGNLDYWDARRDEIDRLYMKDWGRKMKPEELKLLYLLAMAKEGKGLKAHPKFKEMRILKVPSLNFEGWYRKMLGDTRGKRDYLGGGLDRDSDILDVWFWWGPSRKNRPIPGTLVYPDTDNPNQIILGKKPLKKMEKVIRTLRDQMNADWGREPFLEEFQSVVFGGGGLF